MSKKSISSITRLMSGLMVLGMSLGFTTRAATPTITPLPGADTNYKIADGFYGATITWAGSTVEILEPNLVYVTSPVYGENYTVDNGGLYVTADGSSLLIDMAEVLTNPTQADAYFSVVVEEGAVAVNGEPNAYYQHEYTLAPGGMRIPEPTTVPPYGTGGKTRSLSTITLNYNNLFVGASDEVAGTNIANVPARLYIGSPALGKYYDGAQGFTEVNSLTVKGVNPKSGSSRWFESIEIVLPETYTDPSVWYNLYIPAGKLTVMNADGDEATVNEDIIFVFTVADIIMTPQQYQSVSAAAFDGLILDGENVQLNDASKIALYSGWYEDETEIQNARPLATGVAASDNATGYVHVQFPGAGELYSATYTILIPDGSINGFTMNANLNGGGNPKEQLQFTITGNNQPASSLTVGATPADNSVVEAIDAVKVWWGGHLRISDAKNLFDPENPEGGNTRINGKLSINGEAAQNVTFNIVAELRETASDDETGSGDGVDYDYSLLYTPETPFTAPGEYTFTIPAGSVQIYINNFSQPKNDEVVLKYTIEGEIEPEPEPGITLPEPVVSNNATYYTGGGYFDAFDVIWWKEVNSVPYTLQLVDANAITITQDDRRVLGSTANLTEFQETEDSENFNNARLVVTLDMLTMDMGSTFTLHVPAGAVNVMVDGEAVPCQEITSSFLLEDKKVDVNIPDATVNPANNSEVEAIGIVTLSWTGFDVRQRLNDEGEPLKEITCSIDGGAPQNVDLEYIGEESGKFAGYYKEIGLQINSDEAGLYVITIPAGALYFASESTGSVENEEIVLTYNVKSAVVEPDPELEYMTRANISPANGSVVDNMGQVLITWPQYTLDLRDEAGNPVPAKTAVDLPLDAVKVYINGEENTVWKTSMGSSLKAINAATTNEGTGGSDESAVAEIVFSPGDMAFFWNGTVNILIDANIVKTTTGEVNPAFDLTYYVGGYETVSPAIFEPEEGTIFDVNKAQVYVSWEGREATGFVADKIFYDSVNEEGDLEGRTVLTEGMLSIENGKLLIDLTSLGAGSYSLTLSQGAVTLGGNFVNADAFYNFKVQEFMPTTINPEIKLTEDDIILINWDKYEIELTDDFAMSVTNSEGVKVEVSADNVSIDEDNNLVVDIMSLGFEGDSNYTLVLAANSVLIDEMGTMTYNVELTYSFMTTSSVIFTADNEEGYRVYNLAGVNVLNADSAEGLKALEPGFYIINGKKVVIK